MIPTRYRNRFVPGEATILGADNITLRTVLNDGFVVAGEPELVPLEAGGPEGDGVVVMVELRKWRGYEVIITDGEYWARVTRSGYFFIPNNGMELTKSDKQIIDDAIIQAVG